MNNTSVQTLATSLRNLRIARGLTLQQLSDQCGVSRASLSRIENGEVSPTADTLGRLASTYSLPISQLLAPLEQNFTPLIRHACQTTWEDTANGFLRRIVSPPGGELSVEIIEGNLQANHCINYAHPAFTGHEHHLVMLSGSLELTIENTLHQLREGDCLRYRLYGGSQFKTHNQPARYIIAMTKRSM
ncbi:helix-turn-helix domain-containing protein [Mangrovibacter phragmitis]|uniref:helix-turn-helix domain-containing protein n=1 Tax=Mangrovibacter phragmitis TaxID=1691903 RepID=UPI003517FECF